MFNSNAIALAIVSVVLLTFLVAFPFAVDAQLPASPSSAENTSLKNIETTVTIIGGGLAIIGTVLGAPFALLRYRKTRAEIEKTELEAIKLRRDLEGASFGDASHSEPGLNIAIEGSYNRLAVQVDPRLTLPMMIMVDALIAYLYYRVILIAYGALPFHLGGPLDDILIGFVFVALFLPIFRSARRVKANLDSILATGISGTESEKESE